MAMEKASNTRPYAIHVQPLFQGLIHRQQYCKVCSLYKIFPRLQSALSETSN